MRWNDEITLIAIQQPEQPVDANGFPQPPSEEKRTLFANVRKVGISGSFYRQAAVSGATRAPREQRPTN